MNQNPSVARISSHAAGDVFPTDMEFAQRMVMLRGPKLRHLSRCGYTYMMDLCCFGVKVSSDLFNQATVAPTHIAAFPSDRNRPHPSRPPTRTTKPPSFVPSEGRSRGSCSLGVGSELLPVGDFLFEFAAGYIAWESWMSTAFFHHISMICFEELGELMVSDTVFPAVVIPIWLM